MQRFLSTHSLARAGIVLSFVILLFAPGVTTAAVSSKLGVVASSSSSLLNGLVAYWKLDDARDLWCDSVGTNHLTAHNLVGQTVGKVGNAAQFVAANSTYLSRGSNADLSTGDIDFTIAAWARLDSKSAPAQMALVSKYGAGYYPNYQLEYYLGYNPPPYQDRFFFRASPDNQNVGYVTAQSVTPVLGAWYYLVAWHDAMNNTLNIQVNNGTVDSISYSSGVATSISPFMIGATASGAGVTDYLDGAADEVGLWKRVLTANERTELYNNGQGWTHPSNCIFQYVFLPIVRKPAPGLFGHVTYNGAPIAGVALDLRFFNGASWSTLASTTTASDGSYLFAGIPGLGPGQQYYVRYLNTVAPSRLFTWHTQVLTSYAADSAILVGDFDVANIELVAPPAGANVGLPYTFQWTPRPATPSDSYELDLYDPVDGDPYFFTAPPLGYAGNYTLGGLPRGFSPGVPYVWEMWVYSPDGGYGISFYAYYVTFSNSGSSVMTLATPRFSIQTRVWDDLPPK